MQTIIVYCFAHPRPIASIVVAMQRVRQHYQRTARRALTLQAVLSEQSGIAMLAGSTDQISWPPWVSNRRRIVATAYVPLGWRTVVESPLEEAPMRLFDALINDPAKLSDLPHRSHSLHLT